MSNAARIEELQKKFDENPRRYFAPLANECRKAGDLDAAIAICRAHLPQQPGHMSGHIVYGQALFEAGELDEARTVFETALGLDPENLIALRHMGDIAARHGDLDGARQWYQRVLDTDPRNEEIQAVLTGLDSGGAADAPPAALPTMMDPALVAAAADAAAEPETPAEPADPAEGSVEALIAREPSGGDDYEREGDVLGTESLAHDEAPPMDWGGEIPPSIEPAPGLEREESSLVADSFTLDGFEATSFEAPPSEPDAAAEPAREPLDLDVTGFGATGLEPTSLSVPEPPRQAEEPKAPEPDAFVTETMAELYLQQGYPDRALDVYRQLILQNPHDEGLRQRMARVEREGASTVADTFATEEIEREEPAHARSGPTIREFLAALAAGQPVPTFGVGERGSDSVAQPGATQPPEPGGEIAEVVDPADATHAGSEEGSRLDALFGAPASGEDVRAADAIATAYSAAEPPSAATNGTANPLSGRPARPAGSDLSLDHVFGQQRQSGGTPRPTGSFSFDQFFAEGAVRPAKDEPRESEPEAGGDEDLEQFNDWLKGLKNQ